MGENNDRVSGRKKKKDKESRYKKKNKIKKFEDDGNFWNSNGIRVRKNMHEKRRKRRGGGGRGRERKLKSGIRKKMNEAEFDPRQELKACILIQCQYELKLSPAII